MFNRVLILATAMAGLILSAAATADEQQVVLVHVVGASKFDVVYNRAETNGTGAALGGLIGASIQAGVESSKDTATRNNMVPHIPVEVWRNSFIKTFEETLARI